MLVNKVAAELIGTFILVFLGGASVISAVVVGVSPLLIAPWGFGLGLLVAIYAVGHVSGGHFNPAVTIASFFDNRIEFGDLVGYLIAQFVGGVVAALALLAVDGRAGVGLAQNAYPDGKAWGAFLIEVVLTAAFVLVILMVSRTSVSQAPIAISIAYAAVHFAGIPLSGAGVNPARTFGPALVGSPNGQLGVYIAGPLAGAILAYLLSYLFRPGAEEQTG